MMDAVDNRTVRSKSADRLADKSDAVMDLAIIGGGPAALAAAIYAARGGLEVTVYEKAEFGGILPQISLIENYPGYTGGAGKGLAEQMRAQAKQVGAQLIYGECTNVDKVGEVFRLTIDDEVATARAVLVASGSRPRELSFTPSAPVSYCALCDGPLVRGKRVAVIGGANSAVQEALYLAQIAREVTIITHSQLKADPELLNQLPKYPNIRVRENVEPMAENLVEFEHIFVYIGKLPATDFLADLTAQYAILSRDGYVMTDQDNQYRYQTVLSGLFAAGDVRKGATKQVVVATAEGAEAAIEIVDYLRK